jgi:hypothetical protein
MKKLLLFAAMMLAAGPGLVQAQGNRQKAPRPAPAGPAMAERAELEREDQMEESKADTKKEARKPKMVSAEEWGSQPKPFHDEYKHTPQRVLIHHAGVEWKEGNDPFKTISGLQSWGQREKGWMDVPYHFQIAPDGTIFEGRSLEYRPDTNTTFDPTGHINVELMGNFEVQRVSEAQLRSAAEITAWLIDEYDMKVEEIQGHKDVAETACPGKDLYRYLHDGPFNGWVEAALAGKRPKVELLPPAEGGPEVMIPGTKENWLAKKQQVQQKAEQELKKAGDEAKKAGEEAKDAGEKAWKDAKEAGRKAKEEAGRAKKELENATSKPAKDKVKK